jgi:hypothetical protein
VNNKNLEHKDYSGEVNSRENSPRDSYRVESPDKRADTCSPEETTSRSYSSHKNDDIGSRSPLHHNNDSVGSQSPENLSSSRSAHNININNSNNHNNHNNSSNNNNNNSSNSNNNNGIHQNPSVSDMLDHKLQLSFLGPPLAALHSMTEMKSQNSPQTSQNAQCVTNPHGIDSILSRPTPVTSAHLNALGGKHIMAIFIYKQLTEGYFILFYIILLR